MDKVRIEEYHATRDFSDKGFRSSCYAPHVSMYFDTLGNVLACCQNAKYPMGNVTRERLPQIWHGERAGKLRRALQKDSFGAGCQFCEWQISVGNYVNAFTRNFDGFPVPSPDPDWPQMMEFSVSNTCNLECIMCYGVLSSSIRARREGLPPLPKVYDDQFFEDLRPFLHHLTFAKFLGGEPFLAAESFRVWDLMHEEGVSFPCNVTTNGTQWNARVEQVLERFPISICISMDGATKETVESIRVNANYESVQANLRRFHAYCKSRGTPLVLTYCLMPQNWHEFGDYLLLAEEWDCDVGVNLVYEPAHCSLYTLPTTQLDRIASSLEQQSDKILPHLKRNRKVWLEQVTAIRRRVEHAVDSARSPFQTPLSLVVLNKADLKIENRSVEEITGRLQEAVGADASIVQFASDKDDRLEQIQGDSFFGLAARDCEGHLFAEVVEMLASLHGTLRIVPIYISYDYVDRCLLFQRSNGELWGIRQFSVPRTNEFGMTSGSIGVAASFTLAPGSRSHDEQSALALLEKWSGGNVIETMLLDAAGKLTEVPVSGDHLEGLPAHLQSGMGDAELMLACRNCWGLAESIRSFVRPDFEDHTYRFDRKNELLYLRHITIPRFDAAGNHLGYQRYMTTAKLNAERMVQAEQRARQQLADWAGNERFLKITCNRGDEAIAVEAPEGGLLGLDEKSCLGKTLEQIGSDLESRFGKRTNTFFEQGLEIRDTIDAYRTPQGYLTLRSMALPRFNSAGHHVGTVRYLTGLRVARKEAIEIEKEAAATLMAWAGEGELLTLIEDATGRVQRAGFHEAHFFDLPIASLEGQTQEEMQQLLHERFGEMSFRYYVSKATHLDMVLDYARPDTLILVRAIRFPHVDVDGYCLGAVTMLAGRQIDAAASKTNEERFRRELATWDASASIYRFCESRQHKLLSLEGPSSIFGIPLVDYRGRSFEELAAEAEKQVGTRQITRWQQTADAIDLTAELHGKSERTTLRCVTLPYVPDDGTGPGYVHLLAVSTSVPAGGNLMERLDRIAAELKGWAGSDQFFCAVEDEFGRILEVDADVPSFLGADIASLPSRGMPSVTAEIEERLGSPSIRREGRRPGEIDISLYYLPKGSVVSVRSVTLPSPLSDRTVGAIRLAVAKQLDAPALAAEAERARQLLRDWSGEDHVLGFVMSGDQVLTWHGTETDWHGFGPNDVNGKSMGEFHQHLAKRLGQIDYQVTSIEPFWDDVTVTFRGAEGTRQARCLILPAMDGEGNPIGRLQLIAMAPTASVNGTPTASMAAAHQA